MLRTKWMGLDNKTNETCGHHTHPLGNGRYAFCGAPATWGRLTKDKPAEYACDMHAIDSFPYTEDELTTRQRVYDVGVRYGTVDAKNGREEPSVGELALAGDHQDAYLEGWRIGHGKAMEKL